MTNLNRIRTVGFSGAQILGVGLGGADCSRAIERSLRANVMIEALTLLREQIEGGSEPWEWAGYAGRTNRKEYEQAMAVLLAEAESQASDASSEMMFGAITRRMHKREVLKLCEEYAANRRAVAVAVNLLLAAGRHVTLRPGLLP